MTCETCRFYQLSADKSAGLCHRFPPVRTVGVQLAMFPAVDEADWCGEYKPAERDAPKPKRSA